MVFTNHFHLMIFGVTTISKAFGMKKFLQGIWQFLSYICVPQWCVKKRQAFFNKKENIKVMENFAYSDVYNTPFSEQLAFNIDMFNYRVNRMMSIDTHLPENKMEFLMAFDSAIVLFRALFLENREQNYTLQNYYRKTGRDKEAEQIDELLNEPFAEWMDWNRRKVFKFIADKFV